MRVRMGEIIDVTKDFSMRNLSITQKISAIMGAAVADSKILGRKRKDLVERELRKKNESIDLLKDGILAVLQYHLMDNLTLAQYNQRAKAIELALERKHEDILPEVLKSKEFNQLNIEWVNLDPDLVNSFGHAVPVVLRISRKEILYEV